jgi:hypothetical protein
MLAMRSLSRQRSMFGFFKSSSGSRTSSPVLLEAGYDDPDDLPVDQVRASWNCYLWIRFNTFVSKNMHFFFLVKQIVWKHPSHFNIPLMGKSVTTLGHLRKSRRSRNRLPCNFEGWLYLHVPWFAGIPDDFRPRSVPLSPLVNLPVLFM